MESGYALDVEPLMFKKNDIYTSFGSTRLNRQTWPNQTYFDSSSFYNWSQDNEPIYDLDEKTHRLWQELGYPTSSINGITLVVSSTSLQAQNCNRNIFPTVSAAIEALPKNIRFPVVIEICTFGDLGELKLNNIKIDYGGSLEIINRNYARFYSASSVAVSSLYQGGFKPFNIVSSVDVIRTLTSTSSVGISSLVFSGSNDIRFLNPRFALAAKAYDGNGIQPGLTLSIRNSQLPWAGGSSLSCTPYEHNAVNDVEEPTILGFDLSSYNKQVGSTSYMFRTPATVGTTKVTGMVFGNFLKYIQIENCDGPIFIRNLFVDGIHGGGITEDGIDIHNSNDFFIENCVAARCRQNGFHISHSKGVFSRGIVAYRNYFVSGSVLMHTNSAGIKLINSEVSLSGAVATMDPEFTTGDNLFNVSRNANGIILDNSILRGGIGRTTQDVTTQMFLTSEYNMKKGILAINSEVDLRGRLDVFNNRIGIDAENSIVNIDEFFIDKNLDTGILCKGSAFTYNNNKFKATNPVSIAGVTQYCFSGNGQHLVLDNSVFSPAEVSAYPDNVGQVRGYLAHGVVYGSGTDIDAVQPAIEISNGSKLHLIHPRLDRPANQTITNRTCHGSLVAVRSNSKALFQGSNAFANIFKGPESYSTQRKQAGLYADGNSEIEFTGPTVIAQFAVDALAENNSIISFNPAMQGSRVDVSGFNLINPQNHTCVELHATKACLVANKGSVINLKNLGDYNQTWPSLANSNGVSAMNDSPEFLPGTGGQGVSAFTRAGSMNFYPNPEDSNVIAASSTDTVESAPVFTNNVFSQSTRTPYNYAIEDPFAPPLTKTLGGMCVRALGNSKVDVFNVHFLAGFGQTSGVIYDSSSSQCDRLHIWNIADESYLHAAYCSVSGVYPMDAGYHGPSAVWTTGAGAIAFGAASNTPDTSTLSVLDTFGLGADAAWRTSVGNLYYGQYSWLNQGPFRLYVSPHSSAKVLTEVARFGAPYQIFAQGYNCSGNLSAAPATSALFFNLVKLDSNATTKLATSGFYFCKDFVDPNTHARIMLDESAANTFANAKNGAAGTSNRPKICTIYKSHTSQGGEAAANTTLQQGRGFKSANVFSLDRDL